jgi:methyl-accepting chemotaxis protein
MDKIISINSRIAEQINTDGDVTFAASVRILVIVSLAGIFLAMGLGVFLSRSLSNGIKLLVKTAEQISQTDLPSFADAIAAIANGDLTKSVSVQTQNVAYDSKDEMGDLARTFNAMITKLQDVGTNFTRMTTNLQELIGEVSESALTVGSTSNQLATAADQTGNVVNQVATTIQQVALGTAQQTQSTTQVATSVEQLSQAIRGVAKGAQEQNNAVNQTYSLVNQLSNAIKEVTQGALEQASGMSQANGSIEMLATALERVALRSDKVSAEAGGAVAASEEGAQIAGKTMQGMKQVASATEQLAGNVRELGKRSAEIGAIVDVIDDIASQTNLLALNAAIEAARTGEHGKGFAVVADEVRKLAERSTVATKEITAMIKGVQSRADEVVQAMGKAGDDVDKAVQLTDQTEKAFQMILTNAKSSAEKVKEILQAVGEMRDSNEQMKVVVAKGVVIAEQNKNSAEMMADLNAKVVGSLDSVTAVVEENTAATEEMSASAESVTRAIENVASVSEENSASVEEVSASSEEMSAQVEELSASAQSLNEIAQTLQQLVAQFKLDDRAVSHANVPSSSAIQTVRTSDIRGGNGGNGGNGHQKTNHRMPVLAGSGQNS